MGKRPIQLVLPEDVEDVAVLKILKMLLHWRCCYVEDVATLRRQNWEDLTKLCTKNGGSYGCSCFARGDYRTRTMMGTLWQWLTIGHTDFFTCNGVRRFESRFRRDELELRLSDLAWETATVPAGTDTSADSELMFKLDSGSELDMTEKKAHKRNTVPHVIIRNNTKQSAHRGTWSSQKKVLFMGSEIQKKSKQPLPTEAQWGVVTKGARAKTHSNLKETNQNANAIAWNHRWWRSETTKDARGETQKKCWLLQKSFNANHNQIPQWASWWNQVVKVKSMILPWQSARLLKNTQSKMPRTQIVVLGYTQSKMPRPWRHAQAAQCW